MRAFLAYSYKHRDQLDPIIDGICQVLQRSGCQPFSFIREFPEFSKGQETMMMKAALTEIDKSDILIAEASNKEMGVGIEVGYAAAKSKPVIYIRHTDSDFSNTLSGLATHSITYENIPQLDKRLDKVIKSIVMS